MSSRTCCSAGEWAVAGVIGFAGRDGLAAASAKRFGSFRFAGCSCRVPGALIILQTVCPPLWAAPRELRLPQCPKVVSCTEGLAAIRVHIGCLISGRLTSSS